MSPRKLQRPAFTLLEVLLAMALTALVLVVIAMALDLHLRAVDAGRSEVEQAQLARAILHRMADDIRGAVPYDPLKSDQTMILAVTADELTKALAPTTDPSSPSTPVTTPTTPTQSPSPTPTTSTPPADQTTDGTPPVAPKPLPGLYGEAMWLKIDVSRLPRLDQLSSDVTQSPGSPTLDRVSDLKTVTYYVIPPNSGQLATSPQGTTVRTGLVRRELDRAVTAHAAEMGTLDVMGTEVEPLAPEVVAVEFAYFDGLEWLDYWDSQELGGLPWAIQITLLIVPSKNPGGAPLPWNDASQTTSADGQPLLQYRHVVYLPAARAAMAQSGAGTSGDASGTDAGTKGGTSPP